MKRKAHTIMAGLLLPLGTQIPLPPMPWQIGPALDNAIYQIEWAVATWSWQPHTTMMAISYIFSRLSDALTSNILPAVSRYIIRYIERTNIYGIGMALALILGALSLLGSFLDLRLVDLKQLVKYAILISLVLTYGAEGMEAVENLRGDVASTLYEEAYSAVNSGSPFGGAFSGAPAATKPWAQFNLEDRAPPHGRYSAYDVALSALETSAAEAVAPGLPSGFEARYFPHASIAGLSNESRRSDAIQSGWQGIVRLWLSVPLSIVSVIESLMEVLFSVAGMILLTALPFALVFGLFRQTEAIVGRLTQQYLTFFVNYVVISMLISIGVSGLVTAAATHSMTMMASGAVLSAIFYWYGMKSAWGAVKSSFTAFTGSVAQALDVEDPTQAAKSGAGAALGVAGAGAALAAGMPHLAPAALEAGQSFTDLSPEEQQAEKRKGRVRAGLGVLGGMAMQDSPLRGPATAYAAMRTFGGPEGMDEMMSGLTAADSAMVGLSSRSPFGAVYALERARMRRERYSRRYGRGRSGRRGSGSSGDQQGGGGSDGSGGGGQQGGPASQATLFAPSKNSPWEQEIRQAMTQYGREWAQEVADAVREVADELRVQGLDEDAVAAHFVDQNGEPSFNSGRGRDIFDNLSPEVKRLLAAEPEVRGAARGVIGEEAMPERTITRQDLADAVAYAVDNAGGESGAGAQAVAEALGTETKGLANHLGSYNSLIQTARRQGYSGDEVRQQILDPGGDYLDDNVRKLTRFIPAEMEYKQSKLETS